MQRTASKPFYVPTPTIFFNVSSAPLYHLPISSRPSLSPCSFILWASRAWAISSVFRLSNTPSSRSTASASRVLRGSVFCTAASCRLSAASSASRSDKSDSVAGSGSFCVDDGPSILATCLARSPAMVDSRFAMDSGRFESWVVCNSIFL